MSLHAVCESSCAVALCIRVLRALTPKCYCTWDLTHFVGGGIIFSLDKAYLISPIILGLDLSIIVTYLFSYFIFHQVSRLSAGRRLILSLSNHYSNCSCPIPNRNAAFQSLTKHSYQLPGIQQSFLDQVPVTIKRHMWCRTCIMLSVIYPFTDEASVLHSVLII